jgi:hypothetical protein
MNNNGQPNYNNLQFPTYPSQHHSAQTNPYYYQYYQPTQLYYEGQYFESNWLNCVDKWAKFKRSGLPLNLQERNNPVEVINKQLKAFASKHSLNSLGRCFMCIFKFIKSSELNKAFTQDKETKKMLKLDGCDDIINQFYKSVSPIMANWLCNQYNSISNDKYILDTTNNT